jgi:hypothetical protein
MGLSIDHTLSWEVARVGGLLAYLLATASVVLGLLLSLGVRSNRYPRFITNELHRFLSVLTVVFVVIHTLAVLVDPFTAFTPAEVLVPFVAHYRPLWIAMGIVSGYLALAVWASEYIRGRIGYAWWRRFHFASFVVFVLGALHGVGTGSDTREWWALAMYAVTFGVVVLLIGWRMVRSLPEGWRDAAVGALAVAHAAAAIFILVGPAQAGWNQVANNGNGSGASAGWLATQAAATAASQAASDRGSVSVQLPASPPDGNRFAWRFASGGHSGTVQLVLNAQSATVAVSLASGWSCRGFVSQATDTSLLATCSTSTGGTATVRLEQLRREGSGVAGVLDLVRG